MDRLPDRIVLRRQERSRHIQRIGQSAFPQAFGVDGLLPDAMIAFVDVRFAGEYPRCCSAPT